VGHGSACKLCAPAQDIREAARRQTPRRSGFAPPPRGGAQVDRGSVRRGARLDRLRLAGFAELLNCEAALRAWTPPAFNTSAGNGSISSAAAPANQAAFDGPTIPSQRRSVAHLWRFMREATDASAAGGAPTVMRGPRAALWQWPQARPMSAVAAATSCRSELSRIRFDALWSRPTELCQRFGKLSTPSMLESVPAGFTALSSWPQMTASRMTAVCAK
jgi:hypothetical protein